jgi:molybdopterin/thiamine biosynthesis adenylyltransferase
MNPKLKSTDKEWKSMRPVFTASQTSIRISGKPVPGADDRQRRIRGFSQDIFSSSRVELVGAGGIASPIALALVRKGVGSVSLLDSDIVEASNLNRQRFFEKDIGKNKAMALAENLVAECIAATDIHGIPLRFEEAVAVGTDLSCEVAVCGVDNNPARVAASCYFRQLGVPVIFAGVSCDGDHGYVFVQENHGACIGCLFPDMANDDRHPCPGTPAIADILLAVGSLAVYAIDTLLMDRPRDWNYRRISLSGNAFDAATRIQKRPGCPVCSE